MKKITLSFTLIFFSLQFLFCQVTNSTTVEGFYYANGFKIFDFQKQGVRTLLNYDPDFDVTIKKDNSFKIGMNISSPSFYKISDLYLGHTIFIEPNDKIVVKLKPIKHLRETAFKAYSLSTTAKFYGNITYYDDLDNKIGPTIKYKFEKPEDFKRKCDKALKIATDLLNEYRSKKIISPFFYQYASEDLKARYVLWLCEMLGVKDKTKISSQLFTEVNKWKFTDSTMFVSSNAYSVAPAVYNYYISNSFNPQNNYQNLDKEFTSIQKNYTGFMKDRLMGWQLNDYIGKKNPAFDSCYQIFLNECTNAKIKREVKNKLSAFIKPAVKLVTMDVSTLLSRTQVQSPGGEIVKLSDALPDTSLTLIDCWATWCMPCRAQIPFVHELEKKYGKTLKVIYLSFDKDETKWKIFLQKEHSLNNQYLVTSSFASEFSNYFSLEAIPRYILISKKATKVLNDKMPLPALKDEFEAEIKKYIQ